MRTAILSDVHSNLEALEAVIADARADNFIVLGDLVGYNADPVAVLQTLHDADAFLLAGNHDLAATGRFDVTWFNDVAAAAIEWTRHELDEDLLARLATLKPRARDDECVLVHGSVRDPAAEYVRDTAHAAASFAAEEFDLGFFGHTHVPIAYVKRSGAVDATRVSDGTTLELHPGSRFLLNPGSVGQPRDGDPRASYLILHDDSVSWHRVAYDVQTTQRKVRAAGLPEMLAARLEAGR